MKHYSEVELLELYYIPGAATKAYLHVAECESCRGTYDRLEKKLRSAASSCDGVEQKPDSFWSRQRLTIMRDVSRAAPARRVHSRYLAAAAAAIVITISGVVWNFNQSNLTNELARIESRSAVLISSSQERADAEFTDPWDSEQLGEFRSVIEWESWVPSSRGES